MGCCWPCLARDRAPSRSRRCPSSSATSKSVDVAMHRIKVRVVEDALDANNTIARANRDDFDRAGVTVVNLMSAPGAGKTTLLERALPDARWTSASACSRATCRARSTPIAWPRCTCRWCSSTPAPASAASAISTRTWCARRSPALPLEEIDLLIIENVGNLVCPAEFRVGEDARAMVSRSPRARTSR